MNMRHRVHCWAEAKLRPGLGDEAHGQTPERFLRLSCALEEATSFTFRGDLRSQSCVPGHETGRTCGEEKGAKGAKGSPQSRLPALTCSALKHDILKCLFKWLAIGFPSSPIRELSTGRLKDA